MSGPLSSIQAPCPLATPPLCCLMCCPKPTVSPVVARLILLPIRVTPVALGEERYNIIHFKTFTFSSG